MAINLEMMKQLLAEFSEKEALTTEEIRAVQEQTKELEQRILQCQDRLKLVSEDKVRISEMMQRYAGANGMSSSASPVSRAPVSQPPVSAPAPKPERPTPSLGPAPAVSKPAVVQAPPPVPTVSSPPPSSSPAASAPSFFEDMPPPPPPKAPEAPVPFASAHDLVSSLSAATEATSPAPPAPAPAPEAPAAPAEEHDEHADDTVKSINDALRGLFR